MGLRDILKKKDELQDGPAQQRQQQPHLQPAPEFVFLRSDTSNQEVIQPPDAPPPGYYEQGAGAGAGDDRRRGLSVSGGEPSLARRSLDVFRSRSRSASVSSQVSAGEGEGAEDGSGSGSGRRRRLSDVLHLKREPESSDHVPENLPAIVLPTDPTDADGAESQWEQRATMLAGQNERARSRPASRPTSRHSSRPGSRHSEIAVSTERLLAMKLEQATAAASSSSSGPSGGAGQRKGTVSSKEIDADIQEAIRLHEEGDLVASTRMFGRLADPSGANNPLSQVLYGLALRYVLITDSQQHPFGIVLTPGTDMDGVANRTLQKPSVISRRQPPTRPRSSSWLCRLVSRRAGRQRGSSSSPSLSWQTASVMAGASTRTLLPRNR